MAATFEITGMTQLQAALARSPAVALEALGSALYIEANSIITDAKGETPVKTGVLRASGTVFPPVPDAPTDVSVTMGFGGAAQAYAVIQHENETFHHTVGKYHYLLDPFVAHAAGMEDRLTSTVSAYPFWVGLP